MKSQSLICVTLFILLGNSLAQTLPAANQIENEIAKNKLEAAKKLAIALYAEGFSDPISKAEAAYYLGATQFLLGNQDSKAEESFQEALAGYNQTNDSIGLWKTYNLLVKLYFDHRDKVPDAWTKIAKQQSAVEPIARLASLGLGRNAKGPDIYKSLSADASLAQIDKQIQETLDILTKDSKLGNNITNDQSAWKSNLYRDLEIFGFGRNAQQSRMDYFADGNLKLANARKESTERAIGLASERLKSLKQIENQIKLTERGSSSNSSIEGFNDSGEKWAYEFVRQSTAPTISLANDSVGLILYSDSKWLVRAAELEGTVSAGSTNLKTELSFYDTRTAKLIAIVSVPNRVFQVGIVPSLSDNTFFIGTVTPSKYRYDDVPMAITLVDIDKQILERVPLVSDDYWLALNNPLEISPNQEGINVRVTAGNAQQYVRSQPKSSHFQRVRISFLDNLSKSDDPDYFDQNIKRHRNLINADFSGLSFFGSIPSLALNPDSVSGQISLGSPVSGKTPRIIGATGNGRLCVIDLSNMKAKSMDFGNSGVFLPHFLGNEKIAFISGTNLIFSNDSTEKTIKIPESDFEGLKRFLKHGNILENQMSDPTQTPRRFFFSESEVAFRTGDSFYKVDPSLEDHFQNVKLNDPVKSLLAKHADNKIMDWNPQANGFVVSRLDSDLYQYQFIDANTGALKAKPWEGGAKFAFNDMTFSNVSEGWRAISYLDSSHTGGSTSCVMLTKDGLKEEGISIANELRHNANPLAINFSNGNSLVVYGASDTVTLSKVDLLAKKVDPIKIWKFASRFGKSLVEPNSGFLFIPNASGFEVWSIWENAPQRKFDLIINDGGYCVVLPNGKFAGSPGTESLVNLKFSGRSISGHSINAWRNRPAEVLKALGGDPDQIEILAKVTERWLKKLGNPEQNPEPTAADIPTLTLANDVPLWAKGESVDLKFTAKPGTAPVKEVIVRVNGVDQQRGSNAVAEQSEVTKSITLADGQNWIEAVAIDEKGRSNLVRFRTILSEAAKPTKRYIIAIGVSNYRDSALNLEFAAKDATDLAAAIKESTSGETEVLLLTNEQATKDAPAKIREFLAAATENDEVIAFCAGHGVLDSNLDYVYASHDFDTATPSETGIKLDELVDAIGSSKSLKRLLLLDTCHSGQVGEKDEMLLAQMDTELPKGVRAVKQRGMSVKPVAGLSAEGQQRFIEEMFLLPGLHRGINIIGASGGAEFALESAQWNNGVFTASIIEALREKKADLNEDGRVSVGELRNYLSQRVSELTKGAQKPSVVASERDQDFDLIRVANKTP